MDWGEAQELVKRLLEIRKEEWEAKADLHVELTKSMIEALVQTVSALSGAR